MDNLEIKAIIEEVSNIIIDMPLKYNLFWNNNTHTHKYNRTPDEVRNRLINGVWQICLEKLHKIQEDHEPLSAEKAISILIKLGAVQEKVVFKTDSFRVRLDNSEYRIYNLSSNLNNTRKKIPESGAYSKIEACPWPADSRRNIKLSGERFAAFLQAFDAEIPYMENKIPQIMEKIRARELEENKQQMERELKDRIIKSLLNQYLTPHGITAHYTINDDDTVSIELQKIIISRHKIPFDKLSENLPDLAKFEKIDEEHFISDEINLLSIK